jgi:hypothetical protein
MGVLEIILDKTKESGLKGPKATVNMKKLFKASEQLITVAIDKRIGRALDKDDKRARE